MTPPINREGEWRLMARNFRCPTELKAPLARPQPSPLPPIVSDPQKLTDWQKAQLESVLVKYPHQKILVLVSGSGNTWRYAKQFIGLFRKYKWNVRGPKKAPLVGSRKIADVQLSSGDEFAHEGPEIVAFQQALKDARIKSPSTTFIDPNVKRGVIVLWVGIPTPQDVNPDDPPSFPSSPELRKLTDF